MTESAQKVDVPTFSSKKEKLHPKPELDEDEKIPSVKIKSSNRSSKVKISFSKPDIIPNPEEDDNKENLELDADKSPSVRSLKPVSDHVKTPYSKIKENEEEETLTPIKTSAEKPIILQPQWVLKSASGKKPSSNSQSAYRSFRKTPLASVKEVEDEQSKKKLNEDVANNDTKAEENN